MRKDNLGSLIITVIGSLAMGIGTWLQAERHHKQDQKYIKSEIDKMKGES